MAGCQVVTRVASATNNSYQYLGINISTRTASVDLVNAGYDRMIVADCWEVGSRPSNGIGHGYQSGDSISYENFPNSCSCEPTISSYDCVNGGCVPKATYGTPGVFSTLAACQAGCAQNSPCTGECVDPAEIAAHRQALNNLQSKFCG